MPGFLQLARCGVELERVKPYMKAQCGSPRARDLGREREPRRDTAFFAYLGVAYPLLGQFWGANGTSREADLAERLRCGEEQSG